jgi:hypothetical protein
MGGLLDCLTAIRLSRLLAQVFKLTLRRGQGGDDLMYPVPSPPLRGKQFGHVLAMGYIHEGSSEIVVSLSRRELMEVILDPRQACSQFLLRLCERYYSIFSDFKPWLDEVIDSDRHESSGDRADERNLGLNR